MNNPISNVNWKEKKQEVDSLLELNNSVTIIPLDSGLEAEVTRIGTTESSFVLKVWNKYSKPNVERQYKLLEALYNRGLSVSQPMGWGLDQDKNQVLLTSYDGTPIVKVNQALFKKLVKILINIHKIPLNDFDALIIPNYNFVSYFYPSIEEHLDIQNLLIRLIERSNMKQDHVIHGDFNLGNILESEGKYTVIDWTNGQLGDPRYDVAWSIVLIRIYVGERYGSVYHSAFLSERHFTKDDLELFEAIACLRWILLNRIADLPKRKDTISRVKSILKNNIHLNEIYFEG